MDDFFRATGFDRYVAGRHIEWDRIAGKIRRSAPDGKIIDALERFYGERRARYDLVPSPLGPELVAFSTTAPGGEAPVPVTVFGATLDALGPMRDEERHRHVPDSAPLREVRPVWLWTYDYRATRLLCAHEWGHAFVDPAIAALDSLVGRSADLYAPLGSRMAAQGYADWGICLTAHLVRLAEVRVVRAIEGNDAARRTMEANAARGFIYLPFLAERVARDYDRAPRPVSVVRAVPAGAPRGARGGGPVIDRRAATLTISPRDGTFSL